MPYKALEKKAKKKAKGTGGGFCPKGTLDMVSKDVKTHSSATKDDAEEEEEEEINSPLHEGKRRGRRP